jgi:hypothetical protein
MKARAKSKFDLRSFIRGEKEFLKPAEKNPETKKRVSSGERVRRKIYPVSTYLPTKKVEDLISIYKFVSDVQQKNRNLPDFSVGELNKILAAVRSLWKKGYIPVEAINRIMELVDSEILLHNAVFIGDKTNKQVKLPLRIQTPSIIYRSGKPFVTLWVSSKYSPGKKDTGPKKRDAFNILLFCTMTLLKKTKCPTPPGTFSTFLIEKDIDLKSLLGNSKSFGKQFERLEKSDMKRLYKSYYDRSASIKPSTKGIIIYHILPSWEDIFRLPA